MTNAQVATRYAKSLIELASEKGVLEEVRNDMALISAAGHEARELKVMLGSPIVPAHKKIAALKALLADKVQSLTFAFAELLARKGRESDLLAIAAAFEHQYNNIKGQIVAQVTTAAPLTEELRSQLKALVTKETGKTATLTETINPAIIGGFVLKMGDKQIDGSLKTKLADLRLKLIDNTYIPKF